MLVMGRNSFDKVSSFGEKCVILLSHCPALQNSCESVEFSTLSPRELMEKLSQQGVRQAYVDGGYTHRCFMT